MIHAAIAIGSNSTRLLVADCAAQMQPIYRGRSETRLFMGLNEKNELALSSMISTAQAVSDFKETAVSLGAKSITLMATSATRDAANQQLFFRILMDETQLPLQIISGEEEAALAFRAAAGKKNALVIDIGGGSTECTFGREGNIEKVVSCQMGASRLLKMQPIFSLEDAKKAKELAYQVIHDTALPVLSCCRKNNMPFELIGLGGSCTTCAAMLLKREAHGEQVEGIKISRHQVLSFLQLLAPMTLEERKNVPGLPAARVSHMPHGLCILLTLMEEAKADTLTVSARTNLDGFLMSLCS